MHNSQFSSLSHYVRWLHLLVIASMLVTTQQFNKCCLAVEAKAEMKDGQNQDNKTSENIPKLIIKPGQAVIGGMQTEDIVVTDDVELAKEQVAAYPESPEASFILAVALTRTSMVEQALKEVRRARRLADKQGGPAYFDHMISAYEDMLKLYPKANRVRYGLAWAYYMKAYVLTNYAKKQDLPSTVTPSTASKSTIQSNQPQPNSAEQPWQKQWAPVLDNPIAGQAILENLAPSAKSQIKFYYESALKNLDDLLAQTPDDVWAKVYRAFVYTEYTGELNQSMTIWRQCQEKAPDNPAPYFFLGEGYLKQGNLQQCLENVSKAIALRSIGK
jgi:tetratricopeptide (TPR) repeat protein